MRRKDREITDIDKIETIIASARYMHLGMFDGEFPYIVPLHYGYQMEKGKLTFYVHCAKKGHKLECLKENRNVFVEIDRGESLITADIPCKYGAEYESVMCRGKAMIIEDIKEKCKALGVLISDNRQLPVFETEKSEVGGIDFYDYQICRREKFYRIATVL